MRIGKTIWRNMVGEMKRQDIRPNEMMTAMHMTKGTYYRRKLNPDLLRVDEIELASRFLNVKITDLIKEN